MLYVLKVKVNEAKGLPIMNENTQQCDAYTEVRFKNEMHKTNVCWNTLNPNWNSDYFDFEVDHTDTYTEHLVFRIMDHDNYSADNVIGRIYISLIPLMTKEMDRTLDGWLPIFDSVFGIRGSLNVTITLNTISILSFNKDIIAHNNFVQLFSLSGVPSGYRLIKIDGFVSDFTSNDDPEQQWIDLVRSQRTSNDVRQRVLSKLSNELQYKISLQAKSLGSNAVLGYRQYLDLEKEYGMYFRGIGTSVTIEKISDETFSTPKKQTVSTLPRDSAFSPENKRKKLDPTASSGADMEMLRDQMDSNFSGISGLEDDESSSDTEIPLEAIPIITMSSFDAPSILYLGNMVAAYSVHALSKHEDDSNAQDSRDSWWDEIRQELRFHARSFGCSSVVGYTEKEILVDDLLVLAGFGTAVIFNPDIVPIYDDPEDKKCYILHIPETVEVSDLKEKCQSCNRGLVYSYVLSTIPLPQELAYQGVSSYIHVEVIRNLKSTKTEECMENIFNMLPFMESEIMSKLTKKLKLRGMNAIFDIETQIVINDDLVIFTRSGTAYRLLPLSPSHPPKLKNSSDKQFKEFTIEYYNNIIDIYKLKIPLLPSEQKHTPLASQLSLGEEYENLFQSTSLSHINYLDIDRSDVGYLFDPLPLKNCTLQTTNYPIPFKDFNIKTSTNICFVTTIPISLERRSAKSDFSSYFNKFITFCSLHALSLYNDALLNIDVNFDLSDENFLSFITTCTVSNSTGQNHSEESSIKSEKLPNILHQELLEINAATSSDQPSNVMLFNMDYIPLCEGTSVEYVGYLNYCFIKETLDTKEGGIENFLSVFLEESVAIFKSYAQTLGCDIILSFKVNQFKVLNLSKRNQAQCLINLSGNAVKMTNCI